MNKPILVKDIKELTPGVRIKLINCIWCNNNHKATCLGKLKAGMQAVRPDGTITEYAIEVVPAPHESSKFAITQMAIDEKRVFRYIDLDDNFEQEETSINKAMANKAKDKKKLKV